MAKEKEATKRIGCNVPEDVYQRIEDYRWPNHLTLSEFVLVAVKDFLDFQKVGSDR